jgi:deoxyribose-phosphate aldolase
VPPRPRAPGPRLAVPASIAGYLDHTLLRTGATREEIIALCAEAVAHRMAAVCVRPEWTGLCAERVVGTGVRVATVVDFPAGDGGAGRKSEEAVAAVRAGADELDVMIPLAQALAGEWDAVRDELAAAVAAAPGATVKAILETAALDATQTVTAALAARAAGCTFVKTSTGFHPAGGATVEAVRLLRETVGEGTGVKASGGIRTAEAALALLGAGANRIGTSNSVRIILEEGLSPKS